MCLSVHASVHTQQDFKIILTLYNWHNEVVGVVGIEVRTLILIVSETIFTVLNEVAKVMFLQVSVCPQGRCLVRGGIWSRGVPGPGGGAWSQGGVPGPRGAWSQGVPGPRGVLWQTPSRTDGYCCRCYTSYWNVFLLYNDFTKVFLKLPNWIPDSWFRFETQFI